MSVQRSNNRSATEVRRIRIIPGFSKNAFASVLCEYGDTRVLCTASIEENIPNWMRNQRVRNRGWVTAEYALLPGATPTRTRRERNNPNGRTQEIQRLIGRTLRAVTQLENLGERTIIVDCDVLQADGGTRTAAITGGYVALKLATDRLLAEKKIEKDPIKESVSAISVGILDGEILADLDAREDHRAQVDFNVVMTGTGELVEVQGTAERAPYTRSQLNEMLDIAEEKLKAIAEEQAALTR